MLNDRLTQFVSVDLQDVKVNPNLVTSSLSFSPESFVSLQATCLSNDQVLFWGD